MNITHKPAESSTGAGHDRAAMIFYATGRTAAGLRARAADPEHVARLTAESHGTEDEARKVLLSLADGIDAIEAEGLSPADCWPLLGWDLDDAELYLGPVDGAR